MFGIDDTRNDARLNLLVGVAIVVALVWVLSHLLAWSRPAFPDEAGQ